MSSRASLGSRNAEKSIPERAGCSGALVSLRRVGGELVFFGQFGHGVDQLERFLRFLLIDNLDAKAGVHENIVAYLRRRTSLSETGA